MFQRAERKRAYLKLAITGPSGSGKTYSALRLAFGLGAKVALLDTENGSGSLYADLGPYDTAALAAPFTVAKYHEAIHAAARAGYDVLIIDSLSHAWAGEGGLLQKKEALDARGGNSFTNWASITKEHESLKATILQAPIHVIATMRSKTEYVIDNADGRKATPRKVGTAPIQRDGMEYEFSAVFDIAMDHTAVASKDRTGLFAGLNAHLTEDHGRGLAAWLDSATPTTSAPTIPVATPAPAPTPGSNGSTAPPATDSRHCANVSCEQALTVGQYEVSLRAYGRPLCPPCQKQERRPATETPYADAVVPAPAVTTAAGEPVDPATGEIGPAPATAPAKGVRRLQVEDQYRLLVAEGQELGAFETVRACVLRDLEIDGLQDNQLSDALRELESLLRVYRAGGADEPDRTSAPAPPPTDGVDRCAECRVILTKGQHTVSTKTFGRPLCPEHQKLARAA